LFCSQLKRVSSKKLITFDKSKGEKWEGKRNKEAKIHQNLKLRKIKEEAYFERGVHFSTLRYAIIDFI